MDCLFVSRWVSQWLLGLLLLPLLATVCEAQDVIQNGVNWSQGVIRAEAFGAPPERISQPVVRRLMACRAGVVIVQRDMLERIQGVRIDSQTLVKDAMVESDIIRSAVSGLVRGVHIVSQTMMEDGSCKVEAEMPIVGKMFQTMLPKEKFVRLLDHDQARNDHLYWGGMSAPLVQFHRADLHWIPNAWAGDLPTIRIENSDQMKLAKHFMQIVQSQGVEAAVATMRSAAAAFGQKKSFTGIIIDASNVPTFEPASLPWVRDSSGKRIYPNANTSYEVMQRKLPVAYDFSIDDAMNNKRVATVPLVIKAVSTYHARRSDLVLSDEDSVRFRAAMQQGNSRNARVMIVMVE